MRPVATSLSLSLSRFTHQKHQVTRVDFNTVAPVRLCDLNHNGLARRLDTKDMRHLDNVVCARLRRVHSHLTKHISEAVLALNHEAVGGAILPFLPSSLLLPLPSPPPYCSTAPTQNATNQ